MAQSMSLPGVEEARKSKSPVDLESLVCRMAMDAANKLKVGTYADKESVSDLAGRAAGGLVSLKFALTDGDRSMLSRLDTVHELAGGQLAVTINGVTVNGTVSICVPVNAALKDDLRGAFIFSVAHNLRGQGAYFVSATDFSGPTDYFVEQACKAAIMSGISKT